MVANHYKNESCNYLEDKKTEFSLRFMTNHYLFLIAACAAAKRAIGTR